MKYELFMICPPWKQFRAYKRSNKILTDSIPPKMWRALRAFNFMECCLAELALQEHVVFVWVTEKFTEECREYMTRLGYQYDTFLLWKRPKWKRGSLSEVFEYLLVFQKDGYKVPVRNFPDPLSSPFTGKVKCRCQKPEDAYAQLEALYPTRAKMQIFGTCSRRGWDVFQRNNT
jgi:N6-adenosine-specific RNA methylase IME4